MPKPISQARLDANRRNGRLSTGPRTIAGKATSSRNALRHGLRVPILADPAWSEQIKAYARQVAGEGAGTELFELACRVAEAQMDLVRIRLVKTNLYAQVEKNPKDGKLLAKLAVIDRYDGRAFSRRKFAIREFAVVHHEAAARAAKKQAKPAAGPVTRPG